MKTFKLGTTDLTVPAIVGGMMRIEPLSDAEVRALYDAYRSAGVNFFDHADIYGPSAPFHGCERRFTDALKLSASERAEIVLQTKVGINLDGPYFDFSYEHIIENVNNSLAALNTDYVDVLLLHRPDALVEPEEVARAFDELASQGKVLHFGVSNHTPAQIDLLKRYVKQPFVANQLQLSITHAPIVAQGLGANIEDAPQSASRDLGIVDYCRLHDLTVQAWSPFQSTGVHSGVFLGNPAYKTLNDVIDRLAAQYDVPVEAIATAWITRHPADMQVVLGTTNPERVAASAKGADVTLTRPEWYELFRAAGYLVP